ncbi:MAG: hypothetical protein IPM29_26875 [Planctomycetes bacterium]|nr:hypothetical protein [Planctomycetota bacterium]
MNTHSVALSSSVLALVASVSAQGGVISPLHFATAEAPVLSALPLAHPQTVLRHQQIHDDLPFRPRLVRALAFRRDAVDAVFVPFVAELDVTMSAAARSSAAPSAVFAANHGANPSVVVARRIVQFPGTVNPRALPAPFDYVIPFDAPYSVSLSVCWDMRVHSHSSTSAVFDAVQSPAGSVNPGAAVLFFGSGCRASGSSVPMEAAGAFGGDWASGQFSVQCGGRNGPRNAVHAAMVGLTSQQWAQIPLPFLLPGSATGSSGPCFVQNDIVDTIPGASNAAGDFFTRVIAINLDSSQHGVTLFHHVVAVDAGANLLGIVSSNGLARQIVAPFVRPSVAQITRLGDHSASGTASPGTGVVTLFMQ